MVTDHVTNCATSLSCSPCIITPYLRCLWVCSFSRRLDVLLSFLSTRTGTSYCLSSLPQGTHLLPYPTLYSLLPVHHTSLFLFWTTWPDTPILSNWSSPVSFSSTPEFTLFELVEKTKNSLPTPYRVFYFDRNQFSRLACWRNTILTRKWTDYPLNCFDRPYTLRPLEKLYVN